MHACNINTSFFISSFVQIATRITSRNTIITKSRRHIYICVCVCFVEVSSGSPAHAFTVRSLEFQKHGTSARYWNNLKPPDNSPPTWYFIITFYIVARYQKQFETINLEKNYKLNELEIKIKFLNFFSRKFIFRFWFLKAIYSSKLSHRERVKFIFKSFVLPITILPKNIIFYSQQIRKFKIKIRIFNNLKSSHAIIIFPNAKIILQFWFLETNILLMV